MWYAILLAAVGLGGSYFAAAFTRSRPAIAAAGLVSVLNPVVLTDSVNSMTLLSLALMGILGGVVLRAALGRAPRPAIFAVLSLPSAYLINNPPSLAVLVVWVLALALLSGPLLEDGSTPAAVRYLWRASPWANILLNAWWIVPFLLTLGASDEDLRVAAETSVRTWSWTHARASLENVLTLNTKWAWDDPRYYPSAAGLGRGIWNWLPFLLPVSALMAPIVAKGRRRRTAALLAVAVLPLAFVAKGVHSPLGGVNLWLYDHIPGFQDS